MSTLNKLDYDVADQILWAASLTYPQRPYRPDDLAANPEVNKHSQSPAHTAVVLVAMFALGLLSCERGVIRMTKMGRARLKFLKERRAKRIPEDQCFDEMGRVIGTEIVKAMNKADLHESKWQTDVPPGPVDDRNY